MNTLRDYYAILGIAPTATKDEINQAFHNLNASKVMSAEDKSIIAEAHAVLSDPPRKSIYDEKYRAMFANPPLTSPWKSIRIILTVVAGITCWVSLIDLTNVPSYRSSSYITRIIISLIFIIVMWQGKSLGTWLWGKIRPVTQKAIRNVSDFMKEAMKNQQKEVQDLKLRVADLEKEKLQREIDALKSQLAAKEQECNKK